MAAFDLYDAAAELLDASAAALATTPGGAPGSRYVSMGPPVYDCCDLLTVHAAETTPVVMAESGSQAMPQLRPAVPMVGLVVTALRCYPIIEGGVSIGVPNAATLGAVSRDLYGDGWTLLFYLRGLARSNRLFADRPCRAVAIGPLAPTPTQGGCAGWTVTVVVQVDGFDPAP